MTKKVIDPVTSRDSKGRKAGVNFAAAYNKMRLTDAQAQLLNEKGGKFVIGIRKLISGLIVSDQFEDEETNSDCVYPKEYKGPRPIIEQIESITKIFNLDPASALEFAKSLPDLPDGAEGWFAVPAVDALPQQYFPEVIDPAERYCRAVQLIHGKIAASRQFHNYREGKITPEHLRVHSRTANALNLIAETQKGDILIIAAQLGMCHRGRSVRRAREVFTANEFGLSSLIVDSIILTHPERLVRWEELNMDCAGDEFAPGADGDWSHCPLFLFSGGQVEFYAARVDDVHRTFGSASGFLGSVISA